MKIEETYEYDDVLIKPIPSEVNSRDSVDISIRLSDKLILDFPLIASPMVGVVDGQFASKLSDLGGLAILHRFYKERKDLFQDIADNYLNDKNYGISIKVDEENFETYFTANPKIILIDTANGYTKKLLNYCERVKNYIVKYNYDCILMAGNVVTSIGCDNLYSAGCELIRVGIGSGGNCITRNQTGISIPNISAIMDCDKTDSNHDKIDGRGYKIVADGGIKFPGDFVKAVVAGADLGMSGTLFAECYESPNENKLYGMASKTHMENMKYDIKSIEGIDTEIIKKQSLSDFVKEFGYGIKSAGTYLNSYNLTDIYLNGIFVKVSNHAIKKL